MSIVITGIHAPRNPENTNILALFDVHLEGLMHLRGCALVERSTGRTVWGPPLPKGEAVKTGVAFSTSLRAAITEAAWAAFDSFRTSRKAVPLSAAVALVQQIEARDAQ